jgi:DNA-binding transcriptional ArsR family regulator
MACDAAAMPKRTSSGIELLADPTRRSIVAILALRPSRPSRIAAEIGLSRPATSRQLALLTEAGLIRWWWFAPDRRGSLYSLEPHMVAPILAWLAGTDVGAPVKYQSVGTLWRPKRTNKPRINREIASEVNESAASGVDDAAASEVDDSAASFDSPR